ncbi:SDR family oxidoreductase [Kocuria sp.]|uniref:SDR family oxidoreductase n=1 Tax=Kocuria sp. TaxID=1871328 RepID=UPI0026DEBA71|nr:SDR family oxidoreductase [Kocuria sp.]MDO5619535.1 SDR family oxidoreductase [Kocuria sp.]
MTTTPAHRTAQAAASAGSDAADSSLPVALVTGATGGIGWCVAEDLARDHRVIAVGRDQRRLAELESLSPRIQTVSADLLDFAALPELVDGLGRLDVLVHAAAVAHRVAFADARPEDWRLQLELNVMVPAELTRAALPLLRASRGTVVLINSGAGFNASGGNAIYAASKFALRALGDALRQEVEPDGIRVASVHPGPVDTQMLRGIYASMDKPYQAEEYIRPESVAQAVRTVVEAGQDVQITTVSVRPRVEQKG